MNHSTCYDKTFWEKRLWRDGYRFVAGLDEAGRGAWAGPVVAAAVVLHPDTDIPGVDDSKKLKPQKREELFEIIRHDAAGFGIGVIEPSVIDRINIQEAAFLAMRQALEKLSVRAEYLLVDGNRGIGVDIPQKLLVGGDGLSASIGAASILAKVTRDRLMTEMEKKYPSFRFSRHKGYGTRQHLAEIQNQGPLAIHRMSFEPIRSLIK
ncbi:MAG: ribonuclease HII [Deltaproteobacteria bacterium]|nr:ribonuclease HII [Deltaproteobacteria bacterium]